MDDILPVLNPVLRVDLTAILELTPLSRRIDVALAFSGLHRDEWIRRAGFATMSPSYLNRWFDGVHRLPFGAAVRFSSVFGVDPRILFAFLLM